MHGLSSSAAHRTLVIMCVVFFSGGLLLAVIGPSLPFLAARSGLDIAALGGLFTIFSTGVIMTQFGIGWANRRFGMRATLAISMLLVSIGGVAIAEGYNSIALFGAGFLCGTGFGGIIATGNTLTAQLFPERSTAVLNMVNLFFGIGSIVGPALAATATSYFGAPQLALWVGAGLMALFAPVMLKAPAGESSTAIQNPGAIRSIFQVRGWVMGLLLLLYTGSEIGFGAWLALYMTTSTELNATNAALVVSGFWLALTSGRALATVFGSRLSTQNLLKLALAGILVGAALLMFSIGNLVLTIVSVCVIGLSCGPVFPTAIALVTSSLNGSKQMSTVLVLGNIGGLTLPALIGLLLTRSGPSAVTLLLVAAALAMIGLISIAVQRQPEALLPNDVDCAPAG